MADNEIRYQKIECKLGLIFSYICFLPLAIAVIFYLCTRSMDSTKRKSYNEAIENLARSFLS